MSDANDPSTRPIGPPDPDDGVSIARRRALLKGLGKGAALAGAATPLASLAATSERMKLVVNGTAVVCTVSGTMSVIVSASAPTLTCSGSKTTVYKSTTTTKFNLTKLKWETVKTYASWPAAATKAGYLPATAFSTAFGGGTNTSLGELIDKATPTNEGYWVCALLNSYGSYYPYDAKQVVDHYKNKPTALAFHKLVAGYV